MQNRAVNGYTEEEVDAALRGIHTGNVEYRIRFELLDIENQFLRDIQNVVDGQVRHTAEQLIKRTAHFVVDEVDLELDDYDVQVINDGALFYWRLGEASGATAQDATANNRDGTYNGTVGYNETSLLAGVTDNGAVLFNGTNTNVSIADASWMDVASLTCEAWIQVDTPSGSTSPRIISRDTAAPNTAFRFFHAQTDGTLRLHLSADGTNVTVFNSGVNVCDGLPHHVVATYNGAHVIIYIDSVRVLKTAHTAAIANVASPLRVGSDGAGFGGLFTGVIDEVAFYGRALTSAEVRNHYQKGSSDLNEIDYLRDRLKPYVAVKMETDGTDETPWAEFPVGVFVLANPRRVAEDGNVYRDVQGFDQSVILINDRVATRYTVASGTNYITAVQTVLTSAGFLVANLSLTATSLTLPSAREWIIGTAKLDIINDLLNAANYRPLYFNGNGQAVAEPFVLPASRAPEITYRADTQGMILPEVEVTTNLFEVPNKVILVRTNPKTGNLRGVATNTKIASPTSTVRTGRTNTYFDGNIDACEDLFSSLAVEAEFYVAVDRSTCDFHSAGRILGSEQKKRLSGWFPAINLAYHITRLHPQCCQRSR